jgi:hypothetical protein
MKAALQAIHPFASRMVALKSTAEFFAKATRMLIAKTQKLLEKGMLLLHIDMP